MACQYNTINNDMHLIKENIGFAAVPKNVITATNLIAIVAMTKRHIWWVGFYNNISIWMDYLVITRTLLASHEDDHTCTGIKLMTCISVNNYVGSDCTLKTISCRATQIMKTILIVSYVVASYPKLCYFFNT